MTRSKNARRRHTQNGNGKAVPTRSMFNELLANVFSRAQMAGKMFDKRRDVNDECGYPTTGNITADEYREMHDREPIAARVVQLMPRECWRSNPTVIEDEDTDNVTPFEEAWDAMGNQLRGQSWFQSEEGSPVWEYLRRVDELSGIGSFGVLLLGLDGAEELHEPIAGIEEQGTAPVEKDDKGKPFYPLGEPSSNYTMTVNAQKGRKLFYLRAFSEDLVDVVQFESNRTSPRYGMPVQYNIRFADPKDVSMGGIGLPMATERVHWTRVQHVADNCNSSEVFGVSRMRPNWNRLLDLQKMYAGDAEAYWRQVVMKLFFETHPQLAGEVDVDLDAMRGMMENMMNGLQQWAYIKGATAKAIAPQVVDPSGHIDAQIEAICIQLSVPKRIFLGSERGELASSQDAKAWNARVAARQNGYLTPRIIVPFVDRCIAAGVLPEPTEYTVTWPDLDALSELEKADLAVKRTEALAKYAGGGVEALIEPNDYYIRVLGMTEEEAETILKNVKAVDEADKLTSQPAVEEEGFGAEEDGAKGPEPEEGDEKRDDEETTEKPFGKSAKSTSGRAD